MGATVRHPAVAGHFYPGDPRALLQQVRSFTEATGGEAAGESIRALGCVVPHAGYIYSGHVAGAVYARLELPRRFIILCPNHTGRGRPLATMSGGAWQTPLGDVQVDSELASILMKNFPPLEDDAEAHRFEHALEVQLPFLQSRLPEFQFVPIAVGTGHYEALQALGEALASALSTKSERAMIIASSDMNHYEPDQITRLKDKMAIDKILALDARGLFDVVEQEDISMCGYGPTVAMLTAARRMGATEARLIKYATSGDVSGDREAVVGYAGIVVS